MMLGARFTSVRALPLFLDRGTNEKRIADFTSYRDTIFVDDVCPIRFASIYAS